MSNRSRTRERRKERERQQRRQQLIFLVGGVVAVVVLVFIFIIVSNQPAEAPIPENVAAAYQGIPQGKTSDGFPTLGKPDAPVRVEEFASFACPHCADFNDEVGPTMIQRAKNGEIVFTYVPVSLIVNSNDEGAARAALCAGEQGQFWTYHDVLFSWQKAYALQAFSQNRLYAGVDKLGLDRAAFDQCFGGSLPQRALDASVTAQKAMGSDFTGTPTVRVQGAVVKDAQGQPSFTLDDINRAIDAALSLAGVTPVPVEVTPQVTPTKTEATPTVESTAEATP